VGPLDIVKRRFGWFAHRYALSTPCIRWWPCLN
jgi:hypothetical protein